MRDLVHYEMRPFCVIALIINTAYNDSVAECNTVRRNSTSVELWDCLYWRIRLSVGSVVVSQHLKENKK